MTDAEIVEELLLELGVTRPELEHVVQCSQCSITEDGCYGPGPYFCQAFRDEFRPEPPGPPPTPEQLAMTNYLVSIWEPYLRHMAGLWSPLRTPLPGWADLEAEAHDRRAWIDELRRRWRLVTIEDGIPEPADIEEPDPPEVTAAILSAEQGYQAWTRWLREGGWTDAEPDPWPHLPPGTRWRLIAEQLVEWHDPNYVGRIHRVPE